MKTLKETIEAQLQEFDKLAKYTNEYGYVHPIPKYDEIKLWHTKSIHEVIDKLVEKIERIEVSGGGSGRRLKEQILQHLLKNFE